jgi:hypothetical protein
MTRGTCRLCQTESDLQLSHILPAFVFRWLRESSGNGHIRNSKEPNQRVQDGIKRYWFCSSCEELFSGSETAFAGRLFHPYLSAPGDSFRYSRWLLHFCTSVSWRVLRFSIDEGNLKDWEPDIIVRMSEAEVVWREYLLGQRPHPGNFRQHLLPLDQISSASRDLAPNINRYLMRAIHIDLCRGTESIFTYSKLGRFILIGIIRESRHDQWSGTKVNANEGIIAPRKYIVPRALGEYINSKASQIAQALNSVSDRQQVKIEKAFRANVDRFIGSDAFTAMQADVNFFGENAFSKREPKSTNES